MTTPDAPPPTLSRPARITDYSIPSTYQPYRLPRPTELYPILHHQHTIPHLPDVQITTRSEQDWIEKQQTERYNALHPVRVPRGAPIGPFKSKLGFRDPAPLPPQPKPIKDHALNSCITREFFCKLKQHNKHTACMRGKLVFASSTHLYVRFFPCSFCMVCFLRGWYRSFRE